MEYLWIGVGGFFGVNARYLVTMWAANRWSADFPYGTMLANVSGCFLIAFFVTLATERLAIPTEPRLFAAVGFLGGFTTFSTFSMETFLLFKETGWAAAGLNFFGNTVLGIAAVMLGIFLAHLLPQLWGGQ